MRRLHRTFPLLVRAALLLGVSACSGSSGAAATQVGDGTASELRLGYFANVTHATAVYGVSTGRFASGLGRTRLETSVFSSGPTVIEAMRGGALDAAFIGPNPAINGFAQTEGELLRIVAGTTSGGAALVVKPSITDVSQLAGKQIATPQLGNTQDVAAKAYFTGQGVDVDVVNQENAQTLDLFQDGRIDGGWVPEPWVSRLVLDGGGKVLVDEKSLWPDERFVTTQLVVRQEYLTQYPATVRALLQGLIAAHDVVLTKSPAVQEAVNAALLKQTGKQLTPEILTAAFAALTPTLDPVATSLILSAKHAQAVGLLKPVDLEGIYDLTLLNALLTAAGRPVVSDASLGVS